MKEYFKLSLLLAPTFVVGQSIAMFLVDVTDTIGCWLGYATCSREWLVAALFTEHWRLLVGFSLFVGLAYPAIPRVMRKIRTRVSR